MTITVKLQDYGCYSKVISYDACKLSKLIMDTLGGDTEDCEVPLGNMNPETFDKVAKFMEHHANNPMKPITKPIPSNKMEELADAWDAAFVGGEYDVGFSTRNMELQDKFFKLVLAANYLDCASLLDLCMAKLASVLKGKEPDDIKLTFDIAKDITPEQEKMVRDKNPWIYEIGATPGNE